MSKVSSSLLDQLSGKLGNGIVFRNTANGTVMAKAGRVSNKRTEGQAYVRCRIANVSANYRLYTGKLEQAFEGKNSGVSDFNMYVGVNYSNPVYITRGMRVAGCCVLADYTFAVGSLAPIGYAVNGSGVLVSDLSVGSLVLDEHTAVSDFSIAVIQNNEAYEEGDQITFFYGTQYMDSQGMPRANMVAKKVILTVDDETPLWEVVGQEGFSSVGGKLGMSMALENAGGAWVHSRDKVNGDTLVSTQKLEVVSDILDDYRTRSAMLASAASYGGINSKKVYLNPKSSDSYYGDTTGGGSSTGGGTTGGDTGGSTGGDPQTPDPNTQTVMAPEISGTTPFEDSTSVTIQGPQGASVYYTTDGSTPSSESTLYSETFSLTETTTVKAIAILNGVSSEVASKTFTKSDGGGDGGDGLDKD